MKKSICQYFILAVIAFVITPAVHGQELLTRYNYSHPQMGTLFRLVLYTADQQTADAAAAAAFERIDTLNAVLSDYLPGSELNRLSATAGTGKKVAVSRDLWAILQEARCISRRSGGAFDVTIGPLSKLWRKAFRQQEFPEREKIRAARELVNYRWIRLYPKKQAVKLKKSDMRLDLGGIAKGYALDEAMLTLKSKGVQYALVDGGGDLLMSEPPPGKENWEIGMEKSQAENLHIPVNLAIATSGDTYRYLEWEGQRYSHLIDPRTGLGIQGSLQVTVLAPNGMLADALASAVSVLGREKGKRLVKKFPDCQVYFR